MEHEESTGEYSSTKQEQTEQNLKENKMEGLDPGLLALLKDDEDKWIKWLVTAGIFSGDGGLFGRGRRDEGGKDIGEIKAQLDCLQQEHQTSALASHNDNVTNQLHIADMARQRDASAIAKQVAECCCKLGIGQQEILCGQKEIINEICKQNQLLVKEMTTNTQSIVNHITLHAAEENRDKLAAANDRVTTLEQTIMIKEEIAKCCDNGSHGGGRRVAEVK